MVKDKSKKSKNIIDNMIEHIGILILKFLKAYNKELINNLKLVNLKLLIKNKKTMYVYIGISIIHASFLFGNDLNWKINLGLSLSAYFFEKSFVDMIKTYQFKLKHKKINKAFDNEAVVVNYNENKKLGTQEYILNTLNTPVRDILNKKDKIEHYLNRYIITFKPNSLRSIKMITSKHYLKGTEGKILKILNDNYKTPATFISKDENDYEKKYYFECDTDNTDKLLNKSKDMAYRLKIDEDDFVITKEIDKFVFNIRKTEVKILNFGDYIGG